MYRIPKYPQFLSLVDRAKAAFQNLKKCFKQEEEWIKEINWIANKSQINQIFTRRIKSYLKKDSPSTSFIFCITLLNATFSSRLWNNSRGHIILFLLLDSIYVNLMTDDFKIIVKYRRKIFAKYRHLSPSGNRALYNPERFPFSLFHVTKGGLLFAYSNFFNTSFWNISTNMLFARHTCCYRW